MFEARFVAGQRRTAVLLPFALDSLLDDWAGLRSQMARLKPDAFTRDEWAYLIGFLERDHLEGAFRQAFGDRERKICDPVHGVAVPGGPVAVWLPNNVSLLGPLVVVLISTTGNPIWIKSGSRGDDLTKAFLDYAVANVRVGALRERLATAVTAATFSREDPRNGQWAARARTRLVFGSDAGVAAVQALPHPAESVGFSFGHRESEAWLETSTCDDRTLEALLRVYAVYGQAACTSPKRVVLLEETRSRAVELRDRLLELWKVLFPRDPEMSIASIAIRDHQWASALGWDSRLARRHGSAFAVGDAETAKPGGLRILPLVALTVDEALETLPARIQTVGHAVSPDLERRLLRRVVSRRVKRFVPLADMHQFGPVWDGQAFWQQTFDRVEVE